MDVLFTILLLVVPFISFAALFLAVRSYARSKALKELVVSLSRLIDKDETPARKAVKAFDISEL